MASADWQLIAALGEAVSRATTTRALPRCVGEALSGYAPARVTLVDEDGIVEAVRRGDRWTTETAAEPVARRPRTPALRPLRSGRKLILPVSGGVLSVWLSGSEPAIASDPAYLETLARVVASGLERLRLVRRVAGLSRRAHAENRELRAAVDRLSGPAPVVANSAEMKRALDRVEMVAGFDTPVLLLGETGAGKEVLAREIHRRSARAAGPFIEINCGAIPEALIESELFGHERGAFTGAERTHRGVFERAGGGTLLLDEIGDLPPAAQVKLLRVLQHGELYRVGGEQAIATDVRVMAATHRPLREMARTGRFREDLLYRLDVFAIDVPPLRRRSADLPALAADLLDRLAARLRIDRPPLEPEILDRLARHRWPGNVRELANVLEAAIIAGGGVRLVLPEGFGAVTGPEAGPARPFRDAVREAIEAALRASGGKIYGPGGAAELLELNPATLQSKMRKHGIDRARFTGPPALEA